MDAGDRVPFRPRANGSLYEFQAQETVFLTVLQLICGRK